MQHANGAERTRLSEEALDLIALLHEDRARKNRVALYNFLERSPEHVRAFLSARSAILEYAKLEYKEERIAARERESPPVASSYVGLKFNLWWVRACGALLGIVIVALAVGYTATRTDISPSEPLRVFDKRGTYPVSGSSQMTLGQNSHAELRSFDQGRGREITLVEGRATFFGEHSQANPFRVATGLLLIEMTGTAFEVRRRPEFFVDVDVTSGDIVLRSSCPRYRLILKRVFGGGEGPLPPDGLRLKKGQSVRVTGKPCDPHVEITGEPSTAGSTQDPEILEFQDTTVREAARMFNAHSAIQLVVMDDVIGGQKVRGKFLSSRVESFVKALQKDYRAIAVHQKGAHGSEVIKLYGQSMISMQQ